MFSTSTRVGLRPASRMLVACLGVVGLFAAACGSGSTASDSGDTADTETAATQSTTTESSDTESSDTESSDTESSDAEAEATPSDAATGDTPEDAENADSTTADEGDAEPSDGGDEAYADADSPLAAYLGFDISNPDAMVEQQRAIEQEVQQCMIAQGFEYELTPTSSAAFSVFKDQAEMSPIEFAEQHGYGIVDFTREFAGDLEGMAGADPNQAMVEAMSEGERTAWETAMYGTTLDEADTEAMPEGCLGDAMSDVFGKLTAFMELGPKLEQMQAEAEADPRLVDITAKWTACMSEAGYNFEDSEAAQTSITDQVDAVMTESADPANAAADEDAQLEAVTAKLDEIRVEEVEIATTDAKCQGDDAETIKEIQREYELKFIEQNKATLEAAGS